MGWDGGGVGVGDLTMSRLFQWKRGSLGPFTLKIQIFRSVIVFTVSVHEWGARRDRD